MQAARRHLLAATLLGAALGNARAQGVAPAAPPELAAALPGARLQGSGRLRFMGLRVYDARLWAGAAVAADWATAPLALELEYARDLKGELIAERSLAEMRRQTEITADTSLRWLTAMKRFFPDVKSGDRLIGLLLPGQGARFFLNGGAIGELAEPEFARLFFGIWLSPRTSESALRESLLGRAGP